MGGAVDAVKDIGKGIGHAAKSVWESDIGRALTYAGLAAAAVWTGGAALGAAGLTATGAAAGGGTAGALAGGAAAAGSVGGVAAAVGAGMTGAQSAQAEQAQKKQERAQDQARADAKEAEREAEILRKQSLLASQKSMTARRSAAGAVANKLRNTNTRLLGDEEEKLGD